MTKYRQKIQKFSSHYMTSSYSPYKAVFMNEIVAHAHILRASTSKRFHFVEYSISTIFRMVPKSYKFEVVFDLIFHFCWCQPEAQQLRIPWWYLNFGKSYFCCHFSVKHRHWLKSEGYALENHMYVAWTTPFQVWVCG